MSPPPPRVGDAVAAIATPALVIDLDALERNIARMAAARANTACVCARTPRRTKCAEIAKRQIAAGAVGVCVQNSPRRRPGEAGVADLYISNEVVDAGKLAELAALAAAPGSPSRSTRARASTGWPPR